ncbi:MAG: succinoglycan biosynthesis protein exop [Rhizobium sp.]
MFESKARTRSYPGETEALRPGRVGRHAYLDRGEDGYLVAANLEPADSHGVSDTQLLAILRRALDGDPYPVSGRGGAAATDVEAAPPLSTRIRDILESRPAGDEARGAPEPADIVDRPPVFVENADMLPPEPPIPAVAPASRRRWTFGSGSIALVMAAALAGAVIPAVLASPPRYLSETVLAVEGQGAERQALLAATGKRILSPSLLSDLVARLKLDRDPEFTGGRAGALGIAMELISGSGNASDAPSRAQAALRKDIAVTADAARGTLRLAVVTGDPARSAEIANHLAAATIYDAAVGQSPAEAGQRGLSADKSQKALDQAKMALASFKAQYGDDRIAAARALQEQRQQLDEDIKASEEMVLHAKARLSAARSATAATVMSGGLPADLSSAGLEDLRSRYSAAKLVLSGLSKELGPRHPRLQAQQATVDGLAAEMRNQLQRLVVSSDAVLRDALANQAALSERMTALGRRSIDVDMISLARLEDDVAAAQTRYEADLQGTDTMPGEAAPRVVVATPATAASMPLDDGVANRQAAGFLLGLGAAFCLVFLRKWLSGASVSQDRAAGPAIMPEPVFDGEIAPLAASSQPLPNMSQAYVDEDVVADHRSDQVDELTQIQRELTLLRTKVETYAARRQTARG